MAYQPPLYRWLHMPHSTGDKNTGHAPPSSTDRRHIFVWPLGQPLQPRGRPCPLYHRGEKRNRSMCWSGLVWAASCKNKSNLLLIRITVCIESFLPIGWHTFHWWKNLPKCCSILVLIAECWSSSLCMKRLRISKYFKIFKSEIVRHMTGTGSGLLEEIPRSGIQISASTKRGHYRCTRSLCYQAQTPVWSESSVDEHNLYFVRSAIIGYLAVETWRVKTELIIITILHIIIITRSILNLDSKNICAKNIGAQNMHK